MVDEITEVLSLKVPEKPKKKSYYKKVKKKKTTKTSAKKSDKSKEKPKKPDTIESLRLIKSAQRELSEAEITANCLKLRTQGKSIAKIATALNISTGKTHKIVAKSLSDAILLQGKDFAEQALTLELQRLDDLYNKAYNTLCSDPITLTGIKDCVRIVELRAKMLGLGGKAEEKEEKVESSDTKNKKLEDMLKKMVQNKTKTGT